MQTKTLGIMAGALVLGLATWLPMRAQGPLYDVVKVNLPYAVTIENTTLQPGDYMIKELPSQNKSRVLVFYADNGMKFETSAMTIPTYEVNTPEKSEITLHHIGNDYYFDKVWVQGKNYGYEIPLPGSVKARENEQSAAVTLPATVQQQEPQETAQNTPAPAPVQEAAPETAAAPEPTPEPAPVAAAPAPEQTEIAQNTAPTPAPQASEVTQGEANREELPHTSAGWLMMLLSGGSLSGLGLMLRRRS